MSASKPLTVRPTPDEVARIEALAAAGSPPHKPAALALHCMRLGLAQLEGERFPQVETRRRPKKQKEG